MYFCTDLESQACFVCDVEMLKASTSKCITASKDRRSSEKSLPPPFSFSRSSSGTELLFVCHTALGGTFHVLDVLEQSALLCLVGRHRPRLLSSCHFFGRDVNLNLQAACIDRHLVAVPYECERPPLLGLWADVPDNEPVGWTAGGVG